MSREKEEKSVGGAQARRMIRCPQKTGINLNMREQQTENPARTLIVGIIVIAVLAGLAAKVGVIDQYQRLSRAQGEYNQVHQQYVTVQDSLQDYDKVLTEYRAYSTDWMQSSSDDNTDGNGEQKYVSVSRQVVLDMIENEMMSRGTVTGINILGDNVTVDMTGMTLEQISAMIRSLERQSIVAGTRMDIAETEKDRPASILSFTVTITLKGATE